MRTTIAVGIVLLQLAGTAHAQLIEGPQGAVGGLFGGRRPVDPNRLSHVFDATFDLGGGYDREPNGLLIAPPTDGDDVETSWFATTGSAAARYRAGYSRRSFETRGRGFFNYQTNVADSLIGGEALVNATTRFGRRNLNQLSAQLQASYEPAWGLGALSLEGVGTPDPTLGLAPPQGIIEQRWLVLGGTVAYDHHWNPRQQTTLQYNQLRVRPLTGVSGLDSDGQFIQVEQRWSVRPNLNLLGAYRYDQNTQGVEEVEAPSVKYQTLEGGLHAIRRLSSTRSIGLALRGGVARLMESAVTSDSPLLHPVATATIDYAASRRWTLSAEASREVTLLAGISPVPVLSDTVSVNLLGAASRKLRFSVYGSYARAVSVSDDVSLESRTEVAGATTEVRYALATSLGLFASYGFYHHRLEGDTVTAPGFPSRYDRQSARIGLTLWLPLYGAF